MEGPSERGTNQMCRVRRGPSWDDEGPRPPQTWDRVANEIMPSQEAPREHRAKPVLEPRKDTAAYALRNFDYGREDQAL